MRVLVCAADRHDSTAEIAARSGPVRYRRELLAQGMEPAFVNVQLVIGAIAGLGLADRLTADVRNLLGREPIALDRFIADHVASWQPPRTEPGGLQGGATPMPNHLPTTAQDPDSSSACSVMHQQTRSRRRHEQHLT